MKWLTITPDDGQFTPQVFPQLRPQLNFARSLAGIDLIGQQRLPAQTAVPPAKPLSIQPDLRPGAHLVTERSYPAMGLTIVAGQAQIANGGALNLPFVVAGIIRRCYGALD